MNVVKLFMKSGNIIELEVTDITVSKCGDELDDITFNTEGMKIDIPHLDKSNIEAITINKIY